MTVTIPETLNDITLEQYQKFHKANKSDDQEFILHKLLNIFCEIDMKDAFNIQLDEAEAIAADVAEVLALDGTFARRFKYNGKEWGFIPNLESITLGEFVDLDNYLKNEETLHKAMSVLYRPIKKSFKDIYTIEAYEGSNTYSEELKGMPLGVATAAVVFFYHIGNELQKVLPVYLEKLEKETQTNTAKKASSLLSTDGLAAFTLLARETLQSYKK